MKSKRRANELSEKRTRKEREMSNPSYQSNYAKKSAYLKKVGKLGFEFAIGEKPWKSAK